MVKINKKQIKEESMKHYLNESNWISASTNSMYLYNCGYTSIVYKLYVQDKLMYIGETTNGARRPWNHSKDNDWILSDIECIEVPANERKSIERYLIKHYKPEGNIQHNKS